MIQGKIWGSTQLLLQTPLIEIHRLIIIPHSYCSQHLHQYKWNAFYVVSGQLEINVVKNDYELTDITTLNPGDFTTVKPGELHWFSTLDQDCEVLEIYYPESLSSDIVRKTVGGSS